MKKLIIKINGMGCTNCENHVINAVKDIAGVEKVKASHLEKQAEVITIDEVNLEEIKNAISNLGYVVNDISIENASKKSFFSKLFSKK